MDGKFSNDDVPRDARNSPSQARRNLTRSDRIRSSTEITRLFSVGTRTSVRGMRMVCAANDLVQTRFVVIPARGFRTAVERNRCRRQVKEALRELIPRIMTGFDIAIVCYRGEFDYRARTAQLISVLTQAGILLPQGTEE